MSDTIAVGGIVATDLRSVNTRDGLSIVSFRLASPQRRFDRGKRQWVDADTNWYTVTCFRQLAEHVADSVRKGERVNVRGRLRIREWSSGERTGTTVEIEAESVGHDLMWGTASFNRMQRPALVDPSPEPAVDAEADAAASASPEGRQGGDAEEGHEEATRSDSADEALVELPAAS